MQIILDEKLWRYPNLRQTSVKITESTTPADVIKYLQQTKKLSDACLTRDPREFLLHIPETFNYFSGFKPFGKSILFKNTGERIEGPLELLKYSEAKNDEALMQSLDNLAKRNPLESHEKWRNEHAEEKPPNPMPDYTEEEKSFIFTFRYELTSEPLYLPVFLSVVDWYFPEDIIEAHSLLQEWNQPTHPEDFLELLDYRISDDIVRKYAVNYLDKNMDDYTLSRYLLELVQCLKFENHHDSALADFLLRRGLQNPYQVGNYLFWHLKAEYHDLHYCERFGVLMEAYLLHVGLAAEELNSQQMLTDRLSLIAKETHRYFNKSKKKESTLKIMRQHIQNLNEDFPPGMRIPLCQTVKIKGLLGDQCKFMTSKKVPLWLTFDNSDTNFGRPIKIMFKCGDDLRQDMLTLQVFKIMELDWLGVGLDLALKPYRCISTGHELGYLEIVEHSETVNKINEDFGGPWEETNIVEWLKVKSVELNVELEDMIQMFTRSCAGYLVATYVIGIGDRHPDNFMLTKYGRLFHIDFGHFLGNFKMKFGWKRERVPMVFSKSMRAVMRESRDKDNMNKFIQLCIQAYRTIRDRHRFYCNIFRTMIPAEMPELLEEADILYLKNMLLLELADEEVETHIRKEIDRSLKEWYRSIDWYVHQKVHQ